MNVNLYALGIEQLEYIIQYYIISFYSIYWTCIWNILYYIICFHLLDLHLEYNKNTQSLSRDLNLKIHTFPISKPFCELHMNFTHC